MIKKILKWTGIVVGSLVAVLVLFFVVTYFMSESRFSKKHAIVGHTIAHVNDSASIARGAHIATAVTKCVECHGDNFGGHVQIDMAGFGTIVGPNITMGGVTVNFTGDDWERAVRHGVAPGGVPLRFMPSKGFYGLSDQELTDVVAYIRSLPPISKPAPSTSIGPIMRALYVANIFPLLDVEEIKDHKAAHGVYVPVAATAEYGKHLADASGCISCHGDHLSGGPIPGAPSSIPIPRNITPDVASGLGKWTLTDFKHALRDGKRPSGDTINTFMPWKYIGQMHDEEIEALWLYLRTVPSMKFGNR